MPQLPKREGWSQIISHCSEPVALNSAARIAPLWSQARGEQVQGLLCARGTRGTGTSPGQREVESRTGAVCLGMAPVGSGSCYTCPFALVSWKEPSLVSGGSSRVFPAGA